MTTKLWIKIAIYAFLGIGITVMTVLYSSSRNHVKTLKNQVNGQSAVIDSLLRRRMTVFDIRLNVTDKSRSTIYGRYNKGTITMPQEKTYKLEIDSMNVHLK
jgi:hypothetical protein